MGRYFFHPKPGAPERFGSEPSSGDQAKDAIKDSIIRSKIEFSTRTRFQSPIIHYADISVPDPLTSCPVDDTTADLETAILNLKNQTAIAVKNIQDATALQCSALDQHMSTIQSNFSSALANKFTSNTPVDMNSGQVQINQATEQAMAVNQLFLVTSDLFQNNCIHKMDHQVVIQKMLGQVITFGGLFAGGWTGIATAAGGQLIANLPLFSNPSERAIDALKEDEARKQKISFLCLYRQMLKTSCMIYSRQEDRFINGLDLEFKSGPVFVTLQSIQEIQTTVPKLAADISLIRRLHHSFDKMNPSLNMDKIKSDSVPNFEQLKLLCKESHSNSTAESNLTFQVTHSNFYPLQIVEALVTLRDLCQDLARYKYTKESARESSESLSRFYEGLTKITDYYSDVRNGKLSKLKAYIANTMESLEYFNSLRTSLRRYQDRSQGNLQRDNFYDLTLRLGDTVAQTSFSSLIEQYHRRLTKHHRSHESRSTKGLHHDQEIRSNALVALLKACQTLDPTLTCMYPDPWFPSAFQSDWVRHCVGRQSTLCRDVLSTEEKSELLTHNPELLGYFESLCGPTKSPLRSTLKPLGQSIGRTPQEELMRPLLDDPQTQSPRAHSPATQQSHLYELMLEENYSEDIAL